ncbi:MAG: BON domain-containing protein [Sulfuricella sp.]|jgi:osmotically-inducible protein OsmY|nr:BON domain-containing protein [Sulfuricella sp.]
MSDGPLSIRFRGRVTFFIRSINQLRIYFSAIMNELGKGTKMKILENFKLIGISMLLAAGLAACDKPGPAETAGKKIDQTANEAGKKIGEAADKVGEKLGEQGAKTGVAIDDAEITAKVKAAIFAEPGLKTLQISVDTVKGVVTLSGSVDSQPSSDRAKALAGAVAGVKEVENRLVLK